MQHDLFKVHVQARSVEKGFCGHMKPMMTKLSGVFVLLIFVCGLLPSVVKAANAADMASLAVVRPVISCEDLATFDLSGSVGAAVKEQKATLIDTPKGQFCKVTGQIAPAIGFEVDLPVQHWTQRFLLGG